MRGNKVEGGISKMCRSTPDDRISGDFLFLQKKHALSVGLAEE